jgi:hopene-associated glycosyltransferase HpnB
MCTTCGKGDQSDDGTAQVARRTAADLGRSDQLEVCAGTPLPRGWSGKLWAMAQGVQRAEQLQPAPTYLLFTDADIAHEPGNVARLVARAEAEQLSLVSLMVRLRCSSFWERWLIPAFVFFFQKLYPFRWVNQPHNATAAAAGGCILMRREALGRIGGLAAIHRALIDDCTLARAVKRSDREAFGEGRLRLGLSDGTLSLRPYPDLASIWTMVARTAFSQLDHSAWLLLGTLVGMGLIYLLPPLGLISGLLLGNPPLIALGLASWGLMAIAYGPMVRFYGLSPRRAFSLPVVALLYTLMTLDSALRHWRGRGGAWKGRTYANG